jgi:hypothetical protein
MNMDKLIKLEELALAGLGIFAFAGLGLPWWWFALLILAPDLSALGYLAGARVGAFAYNIAHHRGLAVLLIVFGILQSSVWWQLAGVMLFTHSSLDRVFGFGLKYPDSFNHTHLAMIGKAAQEK